MMFPIFAVAVLLFLVVDAVIIAVVLKLRRKWAGKTEDQLQQTSYAILAVSCSSTTRRRATYGSRMILSVSGSSFSILISRMWLRGARAVVLRLKVAEPAS